MGVDRANQLGQERIKSINSGEFPFRIIDNKLTSELKRSIEYGNLKATYNSSVYSNADIVIVSTIKDCDVIYYLKDGKIINFGSFLKLVKNNEEFKALTSRSEITIG